MKQRKFGKIILKLSPQAIGFPRIAIKSIPGALIVRETEKVLGEKITQRTEEVPCPVTGVPHLRTVEVVEKVIETEVYRRSIYLSHSHIDCLWPHEFRFFVHAFGTSKFTCFFCNVDISILVLVLV